MMVDDGADLTTEVLTTAARSVFDRIRSFEARGKKLDRFRGMKERTGPLVGGCAMFDQDQLGWHYT